ALCRTFIRLSRIPALSSTRETLIFGGILRLQKGHRAGKKFEIKGIMIGNALNWWGERPREPA
ncbi:MAG TPA: hypothetical protein VK742_10540, partial [Candidatus Sulfotelmatobacter sp.]|nr:hypothetical protein [Candidatus Sulfotelmatobacter sp.]